MSDREYFDDLYGSDSVSSTEELESELYSVLHYNSFSEIPHCIKEKYNIKRKGENEFLVSLNKTVLTSDLPNNELNVPSCHNSINWKKSSEVHAELDEHLPSKDIPVTDHLIDEARVANNEDLSANISNKTHMHISAKSQAVEEKIKLGSPTSVVLISDTDSENDSDVEITEPTFDICSISSSSSVECLSDTNKACNMILNTIKVDRNTNIFPPAEGEEEEIKIKWREVASPSTWSEKMKKYYNRVSKRLKYFDCDKIREEIKDRGTWNISLHDMFPQRARHIKRCSFCRGTDHLVKNCPKRFSNCLMCGNPGHSAPNCPFRMCLNCGQPYSMFVEICHKCQDEKNKKCDECNQMGHVQKNCPDTWRRYHATTSGTLNLKPTVLNEKLMCCNCGKNGHLYENCPGLYWSAYPPTSFLVQKNKELECHTAKRKYLNEYSDLNLNHKKSRWSDQMPYSSASRYFNSTTPSNIKNFNSTPKKIKKKKKLRKKPNSPRNNTNKRKRSQKRNDFNNTI